MSGEVEIEAGDEAAARACAMVEREPAVGTAFVNSRGLLHLDAHFGNTLHRLYFGDYGLAVASGFDLSVRDPRYSYRQMLTSRRPDKPDLDEGRCRISTW